MSSKTYFDVMNDKTVITSGIRLHIEMNQNGNKTNALFSSETALRIRDQLLEIYPLDKSVGESVFYLMRHPIGNPKKIRACYGGGPEKIYKGERARGRAEADVQQLTRQYGDEFVYFVVAREVKQ